MEQLSELISELKYTDYLSIFFTLAGSFFMFVGALGIYRFPDAYHRLHASSKCSTLGLLGLMLGAVMHIATLGALTMVIITVIFIFIANPAGSHILAKAAHQDDAPMWPGTLSDDLKKDQEKANQEMACQEKA